MWLNGGVLRHRKDFVKKGTEVHFLIFIENRNWDLEFVFRFDNENEKRKKIKSLFHFKTKIKCPFQPTDSTFKYSNQNYNFWKSKLKFVQSELKIPGIKTALLNRN